MIIGLLPNAFPQKPLPDSILITSDSLFTSSGAAPSYYTRTIEKDTTNPNRLIITFSFTNGDAHCAVNYRQENLYGTIEWLENEAETHQKETIVESLMTRLQPHQTITWKFLYTVKTMPEGKNRSVEVDKAALLIMDEDLKVSKEILEKEEFWIK